MERQDTFFVTRNILFGIGAAAAFTLLIAATAAGLSGFEIVGRTVPFAYPWRLIQPSALSRLSAWGGYVLHNLAAWAIIYLAKREKPRVSANLRWFNWAMIATNGAFILLHWLQSHLWYDGLAQDVPKSPPLAR